MPEQRIQRIIADVLTGDERKHASAFVAHLRAHGMLFERGKGCWEDKLYWLISYKGEYVCFILIQGAEGMGEPWIVWSDDSDSNWFADAPLDEHTKEIAYKHIDICGNCGGCDHPGGRRKTIFGRETDRVCRTAFRFDNPDAEALECMKKLVEIRKNDILMNHPL